MAIHVENEGSYSAAVFSQESAISLSVKLKQQFSCGNDFCPKVRKPYIITKQRERWSDEEHRKFLEALKLYGRAWRKIEEHVGTKTAVQIRSHAQKFFYKVAQDLNSSNVNTEESIEIPPPRPKRKPMHPYPRKLAHTTKKELSIPEHSTRSYLSLSEQDNQSPKSVVSAMDSDTIGSSNSNTQDDSLSPVSSSTGIHDGSILFSEPNSSTENSGFPSTAVKASVSSPGQLSGKLELFSHENTCAKGTSAALVSARSLKLFGTTVYVANSPRPSSQTMRTCTPLPSCEQEEKLAQPLPSPVTMIESSTETAHCLWDHLPGAVQALYLMHFQNGFPKLVGSGSVTPMPLWPYYGDLPFPSNNQDQVKGSLGSNLSEVQEANEKRYWSGSNTGSLNSDKCLDADSQSLCTSLEKEEKEVPILEWKPSSRSAFSQHKTSFGKCKQGFVPYKRNRVETNRQSLKMKGEEMQEKRIQLCL